MAIRGVIPSPVLKQAKRLGDWERLRVAPQSWRPTRQISQARQDRAESGQVHDAAAPPAAPAQVAKGLDLTAGITTQGNISHR